MDITTHPFLNVMWTFFVVFVWISWFSLVVGVIVDVFRREMPGLSKAVWVVLVVFVPLIGVLAYLVVHGRDMGRRDAAEYAARGGGGAAAEIERAQGLRNAGAINDAEFQALKSRALS
jgi:hypothetical protein